MTTEPLEVEQVSGDIDEAYQEVIDEDAAQATEAAQSVDAPAEDPFAQAARKLTNPAPPEPEFVDKGYLDSQLGAFAESIKSEVAEVVATLRSPAESIEMTPDVVAFTEMITENVENPDPQEVEDARRRYVALRDQRAAEPQEQTDREILQSIQEKVANLEAERSAPSQGWTPSEEQHIINAINYASAGAGLNINFRDNDQLNAVMHGVAAGESIDSVMRKVFDNVNAIRSRANQTSNPVASSAEPIPSLDSAPTRQTELVIETRDDFLEAVADGRLKISEYPRYASLFS